MEKRRKYTSKKGVEYELVLVKAGGTKRKASSSGGTKKTTGTKKPRVSPKSKSMKASNGRKAKTSRKSKRKAS